MDKDYSVAIYPSQAVISKIKSMKERLAKEVDWFHSKNSVGHITICAFKATAMEIENIKNQLYLICTTLKPVKVTLNAFGVYPNGAFFIAPDQASKNNLIPLMKRVQESFPVVNMKKNDDPHLSVARRLTVENFERAKALFTPTPIYFLCDSIVLRQFDETFKFNNSPQQKPMH
jgi:2'-5' RNA ligase